MVKEGFHKNTGRTLAIKVYDKYKLIDVQRKKSAIREIKIMKKLEHENVVTLYDAIDTARQVIYIFDEKVVFSDGKRGGAESPDPHEEQTNSPNE